MSKLIKLFQYLVTAIVAVLALLLIFSTFPLPGNYKILVVQSGSMEPTLKVGGLIVSKPVESYQAGDVITFQESDNPSNLTTHRIVEEEIEGAQTSFITKGDANEDKDTQAVAQTNIVGKVSLHLPYLGYAVNLVKQPFGFFLLIILPATMIIYDEIRNIKNEVVKFRQKKTLALLVFACAGLISMNYTKAYFADTEQSTGNVLQATTWAPIYLSPPYTDDTCTHGADIRIEQYGIVTIQVEESTLLIDVRLTGATPNSFYDIWVNQHPGACPLSSSSFPNGVQTNTNGNGQNSFTIDKVGSATKFWISAVGGGQVLRSIAVAQ